jgi:hypothetical protein
MLKKCGVRIWAWSIPFWICLKPKPEMQLSWWRQWQHFCNLQVDSDNQRGIILLCKRLYKQFHKLKNAVFWDMGYKTPVCTTQDTHCVSDTELSRLMPRKIWDFTEMTMKNVVFWEVMSYSSCKNRCFGGMYRFHHQGDKKRRARNVSSN